jgi:Kef-type K+ transport system membrane component KefB
VTGDLSFDGLLVVSLIAVVAPILVATVRFLPMPAVVLEIVAGIVVGPSVLGWVEVDVPIQVLSLFGLAFLLFLAGLEIDLVRLRGDVLRLTMLGFALTLVLGFASGLLFRGIGWVQHPFFLAVALSATSLGLVVPVLKDAGRADSRLGQLVIGGATIADFGAVILLSLFFSESEGGVASTLVTLAAFAVVVLAVGVALLRAGRSMRLDAVLTRLQDTTAEIRVRIAVLLLVGFVTLAANVGLETILGAFLAGALLNLVDRDTSNHPNFRTKLDAIGYGFLVPVFFVSSGLRFDLDALTESSSALVRVPLFLAALLVARGVPAALYARTIGRRDALVAGLLQATSLPFIVTATQIGVSIGAIEPVTAAALVAAGLLSVVFFPLVATAVGLRGRATARAEVCNAPGVRTTNAAMSARALPTTLDPTLATSPRTVHR